MKANMEVSLTDEEKAILEGIANGLTYSQIGKSLKIKFETVRFYLKRLRNKLNLRTKAALAAWAVRNEVA